MSKTVNISMSEADLAKIDAFCLSHDLTRSKFMVEAALEKTWVEDMANGLLCINTYLRRADGGKLIGEEDTALLKKALEKLKGVGVV